MRPDDERRDSFSSRPVRAAWESRDVDTDLFTAFALEQVRGDDVVIGNEEPARAVAVWNVQSTHIGDFTSMLMRLGVLRAKPGHQA